MTRRSQGRFASYHNRDFSDRCTKDGTVSGVIWRALPKGLELKLFYTDHFELPLPAGHRFPMAKYRLLRDRVVQNKVHCHDVLLVPNAATVEELCYAHSPEYVERVLNGKLSESELKRIGFPWSEKMVERSRRSSGATLSAAIAALKDGISVNMAGGTHHAMWDVGEGFCVFNDAAVAIKSMLHRDQIRRACVIDCDVHQGNGTAQILSSDRRIFTLSLHGEKNFPIRKFPSSLDIDLPDGTGDLDYLSALERGLQSVLHAFPFDLIIYLAGADPFEKDRLGRLALTMDGLRTRDQKVLEFAMQHRIPIAIAMAGGYAPCIDDIVDIHANTLEIASRLSHKCN